MMGLFFFLLFFNVLHQQVITLLTIMTIATFFSIFPVAEELRSSGRMAAKKQMLAIIILGPFAWPVLALIKLLIFTGDLVLEVLDDIIGS